MSGITPFGLLHTAISLLAVIAGIAALIRHGEIGTATPTGRLYVWSTAVSAATGLFIFRHGGFGAPHVLSIATLLVLALAYAAERGAVGRASRYVAVAGYSLTLFFHAIPGLTETGTRLPAAQPLFRGPDDPTLRAIVGVCLLLYLVGAGIQLLRIRARTSASSPQPGALS